MDFKVLDKTENKVKFLIKGININLANTLRRAMMVEVPVLAIKDVKFIKNSSAMFDEVMAHRLGLIPFKADLKSFGLPEECNCKGKGCGKCEITFTLNSEGPVTVYSDSLKCSDDTVKAVFPKMPIVKLLKDQELELEATAVLGTGRYHNKYSPCLAFYQGYPKITFESVKNAEEVVKSCPREVFELSGKTLKVKNLEACNLCGACEAASEGTVKAEGSLTDFIFTIESWGQLEVSEIVSSTLDILNKKVEDLGSSISKAK